VFIRLRALQFIWTNGLTFAVRDPAAFRFRSPACEQPASAVGPLASAVHTISSGKIQLSADVRGEERKTRAVFMNPGWCYRSGVACNARSSRYLWVQILPQSRHPQGSRFQGGFASMSPGAVGPWTTVFSPKIGMSPVKTPACPPSG